MTGIITQLRYFKVRQLQNIALSTGILSSGTKSDLIDRLSENFQNFDLRQHGNNADTQRGLTIPKPRENSSKPISILSIDMGIRNLSYAHLIASPGAVNNASKLASCSELPLSTSKLSLNAWDRLAISSFPEDDPTHNRLTIPLSKLGGLIGEESTRQEELDSKEHFAPYLYASHAYTLITSLLDAYKPTHVLIERQRFRSGGGSAVQEWTIRVGVFEGMLYAVLHTLRRRATEDIGEVIVTGVDPQRIVRYWTKEETESDSVPSEASKTRATSKECKKMKIDLIGKYVSLAIKPDDLGDKISEGSGRKIDVKLEIPEDSQANLIAHAYLNKWKKRSVGNLKPTKGVGDVRDDITNIGKLDDLADSLLQGITWLQWQKMTEKLLYNDSVVSSAGLKISNHKGPKVQ